MTDSEENPDLRRSRRKRSPLSDSARIDRLPPHDMESEQGVLGCALLEPNSCVGYCIEKLKSTAKAILKQDEAQFRPRHVLEAAEAVHVFYDLRHQVIYDTLVAMYDERKEIDLITLQARLKDNNQLEAIGGIAYLASLPDAVPSAANIDYYLEIVRSKYLGRRMIATLTSGIDQIYENQANPESVLDKVESEVLRNADARVTGVVKDVTSLVHEAIGRVEFLHANQGKPTGVETGFPDLDRMTSGLQPGEMFVLAARPSMGKTSLAMNIAEHACINCGLPVGVFSLEMTAASLVLRMLCSRARVNLRNIHEGFMAERDFPRMTMAAGLIAKSALHIDDTAGLSIMQLRSKARRMHQQHGIKLYVIDYLQLLVAGMRVDNRAHEIAVISNGIKALAKELNVPVLVLSQLNRELDKEKSRKPRLSDLRESGAIEQDADGVGFLYKPASDDDEEEGPQGETDGIAVNLLIAKQRNGPTGEVPLTFLKGYTRYESRAKIAYDDVPSNA